MLNLLWIWSEQFFTFNITCHSFCQGLPDATPSIVCYYTMAIYDRNRVKVKIVALQSILRSRLTWEHKRMLLSRLEEKDALAFNQRSTQPLATASWEKKVPFAPNNNVERQIMMQIQQDCGRRRFNYPLMGSIFSAQYTSIITFAGKRVFILRHFVSLATMFFNFVLKKFKPLSWFITIQTFF